MDIEHKYQINHYLVSALLNYVDNKEIAISEIQRPFVWDGAKVRDLIDSLYQGYPIGYVTWQNPGRWSGRTTAMTLATRW